MQHKKPQNEALSFTIEIIDDPDTGKPTPFGRFSRNWEEEDALDALSERLEAGQLSDRQALMQARGLEAAAPSNLEIQSFIANRLWALDLRDDATAVYEQAFHKAMLLIPMGYTGLITWMEIDNRSFLRVAHGTLLGLIHRRDQSAAMALAQQMLAWCPTDNIGIRLLLDEITLLKGGSRKPQ